MLCFGRRPLATPTRLYTASSFTVRNANMHAINMHIRIVLYFRKRIMFQGVEEDLNGSFLPPTLCS